MARYGSSLVVPLVVVDQTPSLSSVYKLSIGLKCFKLKS